MSSTRPSPTGGQNRPDTNYGGTEKTGVNTEGVSRNYCLNYTSKGKGRGGIPDRKERPSFRVQEVHQAFLDTLDKKRTRRDGSKSEMRFCYTRRKRVSIGEGDGGGRGVSGK